MQLWTSSSSTGEPRREIARETWKKARRYLEQALSIAESTHESDEKAQALVTIARMLAERSELRRALQVVEEAKRATFVKMQAEELGRHYAALLQPEDEPSHTST